MTADFDEILKALRQYSEEELISIFNAAIENVKSESKPVSKCDCPYCSGRQVILYGKKHGKQRFLCKECSHTFITTTHTMMSKSHYGEDIWHEMFLDTIAGNALSFSEKRLGISHQAAFNMRHKILIAMQDVFSDNPTTLGDVCELDETYVLDCYKGKKLPETFTRGPRKHGAKAGKRGISNEYICLCTGVQRKGDVIVAAANRAKPSMEELASVFDGHIEDGSLFLTDGLRSYRVLESMADCTVKNVEKESASFYHLNTVNNLRSYIKRQYDFYRGVATKYINRYNVLFAVAYRKTAEVLGKLSSLLFRVGQTSYTHTLRDIRSLRLLLI